MSKKRDELYKVAKEAAKPLKLPKVSLFSEVKNMVAYLFFGFLVTCVALFWTILNLVADIILFIPVSVLYFIVFEVVLWGDEE